MDETARASFENGLPLERRTGFDERVLAQELDAFVRRAHAEWPADWIDNATFLAHAARHLVQEPAGPPAIDELRAADLYLAAACAHGHRDAARAFVETYFGEVDRAKRRFGGLTETAEDIKQRLSVKLFLSAEGPPRIAQYSGRGDLRGWFRAAAVRMMFDLTDATRRERIFSDDILGLALPATDDVELAHMRETYREELRVAFAEGARELSSRDRNVLRYVLVEHLSLDQLAAVYQVHRTTAGRWLDAARTTMGRLIRESLKERLRLSESELESIVRLAMSGVDITFERHLRVG